jgi:3-oxoacyl-[acyl-carrier protein] reductase
MLKNKIFVITGGTSGLGLSIANELYKNHGTIIVLGRDEDKVKNFNQQYVEKNRCIALNCDVTNELQIQQTFDHIKSNYGSIYGLVNNAGINPSRTNIIETSIENWNKTIKTNLSGFFLCSKYAINHMKDLRKGSIVNISSVASSGMKNRIAYSSSKAGIIGFTKSLALDHAEEGIRVNCICPGYIPTKLVGKYLDDLPQEEFNELVNRHPMKKLGEPIDIANASKFLLSEESKWITGTVLNVDGGYSIY